MRLKKPLILAGTLFAIISPIATVVSCGKINVDYDFGFAISPINSLNYIKNKDASIIAPTLIEGLIKPSPEEKALNDILDLPKLNYNFCKFDETTTSIVESNESISLDQNNGITTGVLHDSKNDFKSMVGIYSGNSHIDGIDSIGFQLNNGESKWSNGDFVEAKDFVDTLKYILDINSSSQFLIDVLDLKIKNAQNVVDAQIEYFEKFQVSYTDPFGYNNEWESQNNDDKIYVDKIKDAAENLGYYSGDVKKPLWSDTAFGVDEQDQVDEKYQLFLELDFPMSFEKPIQIFAKSFLSPVNRKFVESIGGIRKFALDKKSFLWNGPFNPSELILGPQGYLVLTKRQDYYSADKTISSKIKIYFQDKEIITYSMFDDGYISSTEIPVSFMSKFQTDNTMHSFVKEIDGFGTIGFQLNLDEGISKNPALQEKNFRKALYYAMNRSDMLKMTGWDYSYPTTTWTAFGLAKDLQGLPIETHFDSERYIPFDGFEGENGEKDLPMQSYPLGERDTDKNIAKEEIRTDTAFLPKVANYFMDLYKAKNPNPVTLEYIYDTSPEGENAGITLKDQLNKAFGGFVKLDIKAMPSNVFENYRTSGNFDILYFTFKSFGQEKDSYVKRFIVDDEIDDRNGKITGFQTNPSGSWTYEKYIEESGLSIDDELNNLDIKKMKLMDLDPELESDKKIWNDFKELVKHKKDETDLELVDRTNNFFQSVDEDDNVIGIITLMEKVIKDGVPIISLMEVGTKWIASRVIGLDDKNTLSLQFAYDVNKKPNENLPGKE